MYKKLLIILVSCISANTVRAELTVSYQSYQPEAIISIGRYKMTGAQLNKYGIEPIQVTITNTGNVTETFVCDKVRLSADEIYKKLRYSLLIAGGKGSMLTLLVATVGGVIISSEEIVSAKDSPGTLMEKTQRSHQACFEKLTELEKRHWVMVGIGFRSILTASLLYPIYSAYAYNNTLYRSLQHELIPQELIVAPSSTVTKLMFVQK